MRQAFLRPGKGSSIQSISSERRDSELDKFFCELHSTTDLPQIVKQHLSTYLQSQEAMASISDLYHVHNFFCRFQVSKCIKSGLVNFFDVRKNKGRAAFALCVVKLIVLCTNSSPTCLRTSHLSMLNSISDAFCAA